MRFAHSMDRIIVGPREGTASATAFHLVRGEMSSAAVTLVLFAMAAFVAYMRHRVLPIAVRRAA